MKYIFAFIFSDLGVMFLSIAVAFFGAEMYIAIELPGILIDLIVRFLSIPLTLFGAEMYIAIELPGILIDLIVRFLSIPLTFFGDINSYRITSFKNKI